MIEWNIDQWISETIELLEMMTSNCSEQLRELNKKMSTELVNCSELEYDDFMFQVHKLRNELFMGQKQL